MLGRGLLTMASRRLTGGLPLCHVPKRNWAQVGMVICTPPRVKVSFGEKILHGLFMYTVWLAPVGFFLTQIKVWRRKYVEG